MKAHLIIGSGEHVDRIPAWARYSVQNKETFLYEQCFWNPPEPYKWKSEQPSMPKSIRIYEAHVGMASWEGKVASYREFGDNIVPRIKEAGYTVI